METHVMRYVFSSAVLTATFFVSLASAQEPSIEILGVEIVRGMPEAEVRAAFPKVYCAHRDANMDPSLDLCSVGDGLPPEADGDITFKDGHVFNASRNWFVSEKAEPYDALRMFNDILTRLIGEELAACAKIETHTDGEPVAIIFALPEKVVTVRMYTLRGERGVNFQETLRVNPVPASHKTRGRKMQGTEWCAYVN